MNENVDKYSNEKEISKLKEQWYNRLKIFAISYVRNSQDAEDLVQDTILKIWESEVDIHSCENIGALLYTILRNKCLDYLKHKIVELKHNNTMIEEYNFLVANSYALEDSSINIITNNQIKEALNKALLKLPKQTRKVFILNKYNDLKYKEIAEELSISVKTVEYHISKAFLLLRKEMGGYYALIYLVVNNTNL
ncbi:MAG: RNA polymerase sigma-70 factor [Bacteroidales bacterium]